MLLLLSSPPLSAQGDITEYQTGSHELVFVTGEWSRHLTGHQAAVSMRLVGPVFKDVGQYSRYTSTASKFWIPRDLAESQRTMRRTPPLMTGWEAVTDNQYDWNQNPVLIGWGEYEFTVEIAGEEKRFFLSTLDGNWLDPAYGDDNKIVFYVDFVQADAQDPIDIQIQVYNYGEQTWEVVEEEARVTFWRLQGVSRERNKLIALSSSQDVFFMIAGSVPGTLIEIPFYNDHHHFDVNVVVVGWVEIQENKSITITDYAYEDANGMQYATTRWRFGENSWIGIHEGTLTTYSHDALINNTVIPRMAVEFFPLSIKVSNPRASWVGIQTQSADAVVNLRDTWIRHAAVGVSITEGASGEVQRCWIDSCGTGLHVRNASLTARRDTIRDCDTV
jgi:hypothetical protein